jgi:hypothetical protein
MVMVEHYSQIVAADQRVTFTMQGDFTANRRRGRSHFKP